jgi:hypothetical protein
MIYRLCLESELEEGENETRDSIEISMELYRGLLGMIDAMHTFRQGGKR